MNFKQIQVTLSKKMDENYKTQIAFHVHQVIRFLSRERTQTHNSRQKIRSQLNFFLVNVVTKHNFTERAFT